MATMGASPEQRVQNGCAPPDTIFGLDPFHSPPTPLQAAAMSLVLNSYSTSN